MNYADVADQKSQGTAINSSQIISDYIDKTNLNSIHNGSGHIIAPNMKIENDNIFKCENCNIFKKKLSISRNWNRFYKQKLINIDRVLYIISEFEREKEDHLKLQLAYDERTREWKQQQEQYKALLQEVQPLKERLKTAEDAFLEENKLRIRHQTMEESLHLTIRQLQAKITHMHALTNPGLVENLEKKLLAAKSNIKKLKCDLECSKNDYSQQKLYISNKHILMENLTKKYYWSLKLAETFGKELIKDDEYSEFNDDWITLQCHLAETSESLKSQYKTFKTTQQQNLEGRRLELSLLPPFCEWVKQYDGGDVLSPDEENSVDLNAFSDIENEASQLEKLLSEVNVEKIEDLKNQRKPAKHVSSSPLKTTPEEKSEEKSLYNHSMNSSYAKSAKENEIQSSISENEFPPKKKNITPNRNNPVLNLSSSKLKLSKYVKQSFSPKKKQMVTQRSKNKLVALDVDLSDSDSESNCEEMFMKSKRGRKMGYNKRKVKIMKEERTSKASEVLPAYYDKTSIQYDTDIMTKHEKTSGQIEVIPTQLEQISKLSEVMSTDEEEISIQSEVILPNHEKTAKPIEVVPAKLGGTSKPEEAVKPIELMSIKPDKALKPIELMPNKSDRTLKPIEALQTKPEKNLKLSEVTLSKHENSSKPIEIMPTEPVIFSNPVKFMPTKHENSSRLTELSFMTKDEKIKSLVEVMPSKLERTSRQKNEEPDLAKHVRPSRSTEVQKTSLPSAVIPTKLEKTSKLTEVMSTKNEATSRTSKDTQIKLYKTFCPSEILPTKQTSLLNEVILNKNEKTLEPSEKIQNYPERNSQFIEEIPTKHKRISRLSKDIQIKHDKALCHSEILTTKHGKTSRINEVIPNENEKTSLPNEKIQTNPERNSRFIEDMPTKHKRISRVSNVISTEHKRTSIENNATPSSNEKVQNPSEEIPTKFNKTSSEIIPIKSVNTARKSLSIMPAKRDSAGTIKIGEMHSKFIPQITRTPNKNETSKEEDEKIIQNIMKEMKSIPIGVTNSFSEDSDSSGTLIDNSSRSISLKRKKKSIYSNRYPNKELKINNDKTGSLPENIQRRSVRFGLQNSIEENVNSENVNRDLDYKRKIFKSRSSLFNSSTDSDDVLTPVNIQYPISNSQNNPTIDSNLITTSKCDLKAAIDIPCNDLVVENGKTKIKISSMHTEINSDTVTSLKCLEAIPNIKDPMCEDQRSLCSSPTNSLFIPSGEEESFEGFPEVVKEEYTKKININLDRSDYNSLIENKLFPNKPKTRSASESSQEESLCMNISAVSEQSDDQESCTDIKSPVNSNNVKSELTCGLINSYSSNSKGKLSCDKPVTNYKVNDLNITDDNEFKFGNGFNNPTNSNSIKTNPLNFYVDNSCNKNSVENNTAGTAWKPFYAERMEQLEEEDTRLSTPTQDLEREETSSNLIQTTEARERPTSITTIRSLESSLSIQLSRECNFMSQHKVHKLEEMLMDSVVIKESLEEILGYQVKTQQWNKLIERISQNVNDTPANNPVSKLQPLIRCMLCEILKMSPFEERNNFFVPQTVYKLLRIVRTVETRQHLPVFTIDKLINAAAHKLILSSTLRPNSLASLTSWFVNACYIQYSEVEPPEDEKYLHCCRSFIIDLLFHHKGLIHQALLSAVNTSNKSFIRMVKYREATAVEQMIFWIAQHGLWIGSTTTREELIETFQKKLGVYHKLPDKPTKLLRSLLEVFFERSPDRNKRSDAITAFLLMLQWQSATWIRHTLFSLARDILNENYMETETPDLEAFKELIILLSKKVLWTEEDCNLFLMEVNSLQKEII